MSESSRKHIGVFSILLAGVSGCALVSGLSRLDVGEPVDASIVDATADVPTVDASSADVAPDVVPEAASDADAAAPMGCLGVPSSVELCADFDVGGVSAKWDKAYVDFGGTVDVATDRFISAPRSFRSAMASLLPASPARFASLEKAFTGWARIVIDAKVWIPKPSSFTGTPPIGLISVYLTSQKGDGGSVFFLAFDHTAQTVMSNETAGTYLEGPPIAYDKWVHVLFVIDAKAKNVSLALDGMVVAVPQNFASPSSFDNPQTHVQLGIQAYNGPTNPIDLRWDDVTIDVQ